MANEEKGHPGVHTWDGDTVRLSTAVGHVKARGPPDVPEALWDMLRMVDAAENGGNANQPGNKTNDTHLEFLTNLSAGTMNGLRRAIGMDNLTGGEDKVRRRAHTRNRVSHEPRPPRNPE